MNTNNGYQCEFATIGAGNFRKHMKVHKCNQCDYASVRAWDLKKHKKIHSGNKTYKCNQSDYASFLPAILGVT